MLYKTGLSYLNSHNSEPEQSNKVMAFRLTFLTATTITIKALSVVCIEFAKRKFLIRTIFSFSKKLKYKRLLKLQSWKIT